MNTDHQLSQSVEDDEQLQRTEDEGEALIRLLEELEDIDESSEDAALNKCSMSDDNGGRIELMRRLVERLPVFLFLRRLLYAFNKDSKN